LCAVFLYNLVLSPTDSVSKIGVTLMVYGSLEFIKNGRPTIRNLGYGCLFAFHSNYGRIFSRFDTVHERFRHLTRPLYHRTTANAELHSSVRLKCVMWYAKPVIKIPKNSVRRK